MKVFKKLLFILFILNFTLNPVFVNKSRAEDSQGIDQFVGNNGFICGYPNTDANQCCLKSSAINLEIDETNIILNKVKNCTLTENQIEEENALTTCLSNQEAEILMTLYNTEKNDFTKLAMSAGLYEYILSTDPDKASTFVIDLPFTPSYKFEDIANLYRSNVEVYNSLSSSEKVKVQVANSIPVDKCLIDVAGMHGICLRGIAQFFAGLAGNNTKIQALITAQEELVIDKCIYGMPVEDGSGNCICKADTSLGILCRNYITNDQEYNKCINCTESGFGFWTGLGCIRLNLTGFIQETLFGWALGLAGIIALFCIIYSAIILQTSSGNPERLKKAKQYLTSCILGLLLIIFSIFILRLIGATILRIPGFG